MKTNYLKSVLFIVIISCLSISVYAAEPLYQWDVISISFKSSKTYQNPYLDVPSVAGKDLLKVTFTGTSGEAKGKSYTITGFWNGEREWKVNFATMYAGKWSYVSSSADRGMNGKKGSFEVISLSEDDKNANPVRRGFVRVKKDGPFPGRFFEYTDGTPFMWIGDTWWNWTNSKIKFETFKQLVDNRSEKGFNVGQQVGKRI